MPETKLTVNREKAREIMGDNFFGVKELRRRFWVKLSETSLSKIEEVPFSEETLRNYSEMLLFLGYNWDAKSMPMSVRRMADRTTPSNVEPWYEKQNSAGFISSTPEFRWYLLQPLVTACSFSFRQASDRLEDGWRIGTAAEYIYAMILTELRRNEILFKEKKVWTSDLNDTGDQVVVGNISGAERVYIYQHSRDYRVSDLGAAEFKEPEI